MKNAGKQGGGGGVSEAYFKDLEDALNKLTNDFGDHKDDTQRKFLHTQGELNNKASKDDLLDLENRLLDKIKEMIQALFNQFADKNETRKKIASLEKNIKNLYDLLMQRQDQNNDNADDAMFTKKPLQGNSCASCEKNILNLYGQ